MPASAPSTFLWIHKTAGSASLSHSVDAERIQVFSQAQRVSRSRKSKTSARKDLYEKQQTSRKDVDVLSLDHGSLHLTSFRLNTLSPSDKSYSRDEKRSLHFYRHTTIQKLMFSSCDAIFWQDTVLHLACQFAAFRHLIVAITSTHEMLIAEWPQRLNALALRHCNRAAALLRDATDLNEAHIAASCILIAAYNLIRCDLSSANAIIETGMGFAARCCAAASDGDSLGRASESVLKGMSSQVTVSLWTPDVVFQFEKSDAADGSLELECDFVTGPFLSVQQAFASYRLLVTELLTKLMRNLTAGTHIHPDCLLYHEINRQLGLFLFWWEQLYSNLTDDDLKLGMLQIRVGFYSMSIMFRRNVLSSPGGQEDDYRQDQLRMLELCDAIFQARCAGKEIEYIDSIVSRALFAQGISSHHDELRLRAVRLLQSRNLSDSDPMHWVMGTAIEATVRAEEARRNTARLEDTQRIILSGRITLVDMRFHHLERHFDLTYSSLDRHGHPRIDVYRMNCEAFAGVAPDMYDFNTCLQRLMAGYRMFGKPKVDQWSRGYVKTMLFKGRPVPVQVNTHET